MNRQIKKLAYSIVFLFVILFLQLNNIQILQAHKLNNAPGNNRKVISSFSRPRGAIETSDGTVVAQSVPVKDQLKLLRQYPEGKLFAPITGFYSLNYGSSGIEASYNSQLTGHNLPITSLSSLFSSHTKVGNVILNVSNKIQTAAQTALGNHKGAVVAINPKTGAILALWSYPSYNPNPLASHNGVQEQAAWKKDTTGSNPMLDRAISRTYPPGSTFKVVTSAAVLDQLPSLVPHSFKYRTQIKLPNTTHYLHNFMSENCGGTMPTLFKVSCDTGYSKIGLDLGPQRLWSEAQRFGINKVPPIDIPGAAASTFPAVSSFNQNLATLAYSAIGQYNVALTPLQDALLGAAIANKGVMMKPHLVSQIRNNQGKLLQTIPPSPWLRATSAKTAAYITNMMIGVVNGKGGTANNMQIPGVQVAAKTGTAQTSGNLNDSWLLAFAPAKNPTVVVAAFVAAEPGVSNQTGSAQAGPVAKAVIKAALQIP